MRNYYQEIITQKSWQVLQEIKKEFDFYQKILRQTGKESLQEKLAQLLKSTVRVRELNFKDHQMAKLKKKILPQIS